MPQIAVGVEAKCVHRPLHREDHGKIIATRDLDGMASMEIGGHLCSYMRELVRTMTKLQQAEG